MSQPQSPHPSGSIGRPHPLARPVRLLTVATLLLSLLAVFTPAVPASAASLVVTSSANSGSGSLREAIDTANSNGQADTITFDGVTNVSITAELVITADGGNALTIDGGDDGVTITGSTSRILLVQAGATLTLDTMTLTGGNGISTVGSANGGALHTASGGTLHLIDTTVTGNTAGAHGGAFYNNGVTTITSSTFSNNTALASSGAIYNQGTLTITNSTFSGNQAGDWGGAMWNNNILSVRYSTFSHNRAASGGGAVYLQASATILASVFANSTNHAGTVNIADCVGGLGFVSQGGNIIESNSCLGTLLGTDTTGDPGLGALADNGGPTMTHALLDGSIAINRGQYGTCLVLVDQRGVVRECTVDNPADSGSYEIGSLDSGPPETTIDSETPSTSPTNSISITFTFSGTDDVEVDYFECSLDSVTFTTCTSPQEYTGLSEGDHTFEVRAVDVNGNTDPTPASYTWTVDTTAPDTTIDSQNPATTPTMSTTMDLTFSSPDADIDYFECSLDSATFTTCTSPQSYNSLSDGEHTFEVRAVDTAGNADATPASYTWVVDTTDPVVNVPDDFEVNNTPGELGAVVNYTVTVTDAESGLEAICTPPSGSFFPFGPTLVECSATDTAGNTGTASFTITVVQGPTFYQACLFGGSLSQVSFIGEFAVTSVHCGRGAPVVLLAGDDYHACMFAGALSQVGTSSPLNCGRGVHVSFAAGTDYYACSYAGTLSQVGTSMPNCSRGTLIGLHSGILPG